MQAESGRDYREFLCSLFSCAVESVSARSVMPLILPRPKGGCTALIALGKAAAEMVAVAATRLGDHISGLVVTRSGHGPLSGALPSRFELLEAGHPIPDDLSMRAADKAMHIARSLGKGDLLIALVSGGGSSLMASPAPGVRLSDKRAITEELLRSGASISEINCIRSHLSQIKGGRLAAMAAPAQVVTYVISDIPGDNPSVVASGPTLANHGTLARARWILHRYDLVAHPAVMAALFDPANEVPPADAPGLLGSKVHVIARNLTALRAARRKAEAEGWQVIELGSDLEGPAVALGENHGLLARRLAEQGGRYIILSGGETTVRIDGAAGKGGRNMTYLLSLALTLDGIDGVWALACDTDGLDGTSSAAGAVIGPDILKRARSLNLDARDSLARHSSCHFFKALEAQVVTGPTRTNVNDFRAILIDRPVPS